MQHNKYYIRMKRMCASINRRWFLADTYSFLSFSVLLIYTHFQFLNLIDSLFRSKFFVSHSNKYPHFVFCIYADLYVFNVQYEKFIIYRIENLSSCRSFILSFSLFDFWSWYYVNCSLYFLSLFLRWFWFFFGV